MTTHISRSRRLAASASIVCAVLLWRPGHAQYDPLPAPGPYYFVSDQLGTTDQFYWRGIQHFGGVKTILNLNLLAAVLGDDPSSLLQTGQTLVGPEPFDFGGGALKLQPFAFTTSGSARKINLPLGPNLRRFLDDPLGGARLDLTLPFHDADVALSTRSAHIRSGTSSSVWHAAIDFDFTGDTSRGFDVMAAADGIVEGTTSTSISLALRHTASNGRQFLTLYHHLDPPSKSALTVGATVRRGQLLGRVEADANGYAHLHFAIAVRGPSRTINRIAVPELWYLIDPFGVYDYRRNYTSSTHYNHLPNNTLTTATRGVLHAYAWRTDPPIGSLLLPDDCLSFNPANLAVRQAGSLFVVVDGTRSLFAFPNSQEANTALSLIQQYRASRSCFVGRPDPSFTYLLVNDLSPVGPASGEDCVGFDPATIRIEPLSDGQYRMVSGTSPMFTFPNMLEAGNALSRIRKHGFTRTCYVGRPDPSIQYMRRDGGTTGAFEVTPIGATVAVNELLDLSFTWIVPPPLGWRDLRTLRLRVRDDDEVILSILFDEASGRFTLTGDGTPRSRTGHTLGSRAHLETPHATLDLSGTTVVGSGPTGPTVTLILALRFKPRAVGRTFAVEVSASDDLDREEPFSRVGWLTVTSSKFDLEAGPEGDVDEEPDP